MFSFVPTLDHDPQIFYYCKLLQGARLKILFFVHQIIWRDATHWGTWLGTPIFIMTWERKGKKKKIAHHLAGIKPMTSQVLASEACALSWSYNRFPSPDLKYHWIKVLSKHSVSILSSAVCLTNKILTSRISMSGVAMIWYSVVPWFHCLWLFFFLSVCRCQHLCLVV